MVALVDRLPADERFLDRKAQLAGLFALVCDHEGKSVGAAIIAFNTLQRF